MKCIRTAPPKPDNRITLKELGYGNVCHLDGEGDIPFMYVETSQKQINIYVKDAFKSSGVTFGKLLNLETGYFRVVPHTTTRVTPANVTLYIEPVQ